MRIFKAKDMINGWFIGDFIPTAYKTDACEVAVKEYGVGETEAKHLHKIATEVTFIVKGKVEMNGIEYCDGDIIVMEPGEATDFKALAETINVVVKIPSIKGDKYFEKNLPYKS